MKVEDATVRGFLPAFAIGRAEGIFVSDFEQGEIGPARTCSGKACKFGLEGLSAGIARSAPASRRTGSR